MINKKLIFPSVVMLTGLGIIFKIINILYLGFINGEIIDKKGIIHYSGTPKYYIGMIALFISIFMIITLMKIYWKYTKSKTLAI